MMLKNFEKRFNKFKKMVLKEARLWGFAIYEMVIPGRKGKTKGEKMIDNLISLTYIFAGAIMLVRGITGLYRNW